MSSCSAFAAVLFGAALGLARVAIAQGETGQPSYSVPRDAECPSEEAFRALVAQRTGADPFSDPAARTTSVTIRHAGRLLEAVLSIRDKDGARIGERRLTGNPADCAELVEALALAVATAIDPLGNRPPDTPPLKQANNHPIGASVTERAVPASHETKPAPSRPADTQHAAGPIQREAPPWAWFVGAGASARLGQLPKVALAFDGDLGVVRGGISLGVTGFVAAPNHGEAQPEGQAESSLWGIGLRPCAHWAAVDGCLSALAAHVSVAGSGLVRPLDDEAMAAMIGARVQVPLRLSEAFSIEPYVEAAAMLPQVRIVMNHDEVWRSSPISGTLGASLRAHFAPAPATKVRFAHVP